MSDNEGDRSGATQQVLFVAAENDALPGAKVGGIGDVVRDLPAALTRADVGVTVVLPSYGFLHQRSDATRLAIVEVRFRKTTKLVEVYQLASAYSAADPAPRMLVLHHEDFSPCGVGRVYCNDPDDAPFATDASKYALFCIAVLEATLAGHVGHIDVLHLHDWHAAFIAILVKHDPRYRSLADKPLVYSIHNLALQGVRPLRGHTSSFASWYPWLTVPPAQLIDPRWTDCVNPTAAAIRMTDRVHTVSPTYAQDIVQADRPEQGFHGGEGLEQDLAEVAHDGRLVGILNGIDYPRDAATDDTARRALSTAANVERDQRWSLWMTRVRDSLQQAIASDEHVRSVDWLAHTRAAEWIQRSRPRHVLTSVGRLVEQKAAILLSPLKDGKSALEHMLNQHGEAIALVLIGTGDVELEHQCRGIAARCSNVLFINRYSAELADIAYASGDLFLMPSSFEPCGISQMIAMQHGQPCLVHAVGGLADTVIDGQDGFHFSGDSQTHQAEAMLRRLDDILELRNSGTELWANISDTARSRRFDWDTAAARYVQDLYSIH